MFERYLFRFLLAFVALALLAAAAQAVTIDYVWVGNAGNANDDTFYGGVADVYRIGKYEVTAGQYTEFLNAVAATDTYNLYDPNMSSGDFGCEIRQKGTSGSYTYLVDWDGDDVEDADWVNRPVNYVSWYDTLRFANWLHNGQPAGAQDANTTEDGAYNMSLGSNVVRKSGARVFLPDENQWYKAAYHKNDGATNNYFDYPTSSDTAPTAEAPPGTDVINGSANYYDGTAYRTTEVGAYDTTNLGEYVSDSPYGTFDQGGGLWEWNETGNGSSRAYRGGSFAGPASDLPASRRLTFSPTGDSYNLGFRVASVPEPSTAVLGIIGALCCLLRRRRVAR